MKNKLQRVFIYFIATIIVFVTAFAVFGPEGKKINLKEIGDVLEVRESRVSQILTATVKKLRTSINITGNSRS